MMRRILIILFILHGNMFNRQLPWVIVMSIQNLIQSLVKKMKTKRSYIPRRQNDIIKFKTNIETRILTTTIITITIVTIKITIMNGRRMDPKPHLGKSRQV